MHFQIQCSFPPPNYAKSETKITRNLKREKLKKTLSSCFWMRPLCCSAVVFIGDRRSRVPVQLLHESRYSRSSIWPQKRGFGRISAALALSLATRFRAWPPLVRPSGYLLLDLAYRLFILKIRDNLGSKLP